MNDLKNEEWRPVVGYEGLYEISNIGNVRRLPGYVRTGRGIRFWKGGPLKLQNGSEYFHVDLSKNGKRKTQVWGAYSCIDNGIWSKQRHHQKYNQGAFMEAYLIKRSLKKNIHPVRLPIKQAELFN